MIKIKHKDEDTPTTTNNDRTEFDTRLDAIQFTSEVHSRIKKDINSDFVMAILGEKDKEGIVEMTANAYFVKRIVEQVAEKLTQKNKKLNPQEKKQLEQKTQKIRQIGRTIFDTYMVRIYMTVLLNRNVPKNHILKLLAGIQEEEDEEETTTKTKNAITSILDKLKKTPD